jgi:ribonuclease-3
MKPPPPHIGSLTPHTFSDASLLRLALTHSSCELPGGDNQRLEFLGDAVLDLVIAEALFEKFPRADEGILDRCRAGIVNGKTLARVAAEYGLAALLEVGEAHRLHHPEPSHAMLEDALEALIGAVYLDGGLEAARETILHLFGERIEAVESGGRSQNPKGQLQEWSQKNHAGEVPAYEALPAEGPDHDRRYAAAVSLGGQALGRGTGRSKKAAEAAAAKAALKNLE